ncbi:MAG: HlyD family efflux transporter periplasmic adaptor subunit [Nitrosomonadales bacterium]|nr:HlyD family efflux transporter periplasmic adaptor subunit [Nitrosomonadales bacterium]
MAMPIHIGDELYGVVALAFAVAEVPKGASDWIQWGFGWLAIRSAHGGDSSSEQLRERLLISLDLTLSALEEKDFEAACHGVVTDAAVRLKCDRVSIGFGETHGMRLVAISHTADFSHRLDMVHALEAVMDEAADQGVSFFISGEKGGNKEEENYLCTREHEQLVRNYGSGCVLSVPFFVSDEQYGYFLFEWAEPQVEPVARQIAEGLPPILGRVLLEKRRNDRSLYQRLKDAAREEGKRLFGPLHAGRKLAASVLLLLVAFFGFATGEFRVSAKSLLEGGVRRVVVAPYDGFVASAPLRAGYEVNAGDVLATLDDRELKLEASKWSSQQSQYLQQTYDAQAQHNLAQMQVGIAQTRQAAAQRALSESMLERSRVVAPFRGLIVSGDLSQRLGSAVKKGQVLFEIAPLDSYRIVLEVEEADISYVEVGQKGKLVTTAIPDMPLPFTVNLVTPVAQASEGKNRFRVEASLDKHLEQLRPGMEGIGKIDIGKRRLIWIWTHSLTDWLRLQAWNWFGV